MTKRTATGALEGVHAPGATPLTPEEISQWSQGLLTSGPKDDAARQRFQGRLQGVATQRGVPVSSLPPVSNWADVIELDEGRL